MPFCQYLEDPSVACVLLQVVRNAVCRFVFFVCFFLLWGVEEGRWHAIVACAYVDVLSCLAGCMFYRKEVEVALGRSAKIVSCWQVRLPSYKSP